MILHLTYDVISRYVFETIPTRILLPILTAAHQDTSGDNNEGAAGSTGIVHVTTTHLIATALPLLLIAAAGRHFDLGIENNGLMVGIARSFVQLNILGIILQPIFVLGMDMAWVVGLYVFAMILIATHESLSRQKYRYKYNYLVTFLTIFTSISAVGSFAFLLVIRPSPYWNPQYVIPICGMLMGNCINGVSLAAKTFSTQIKEGGIREIELCLSFGASGWESLQRIAKDAISTGITPMINSLNVIGLISIPGMMTGQILGGSPVTEAAHYQILIIYLISTCTFTTIFMNIYAMYRVAFDTRTHVLRTDRFVKVEMKKLSPFQRFKLTLGAALIAVCHLVGEFICLRFSLCCSKVWKRHPHSDDEEDQSNLERQPLSGGYGPALAYDSSSETKVQILVNHEKVHALPESAVIFRISNLQYSVPKNVVKKNESNDGQSTPPSPLISNQRQIAAPASNSCGVENRRILCTNLCASLAKGDIGIVRGPSGSGKSTLMRVLSGLADADSGEVLVSDFKRNLLLSDCINGSGQNDMVRWRSEVRYVTQYKVDIPGTPREFIERIKGFRFYSSNKGAEQITANEMVSTTIAYLKEWGMGEMSSGDSESNNHSNPYLDKEWKSLSGGECQRMLLSIALSTRPRILLLDEATSGLESRVEMLVEKSLIDYVDGYGAAILWVTHSEDIANRLLT